MVWDGIPGVKSQIHPSPKLKWRSSRIAHESNLWKLYEIVFKKLTIKCICNVLFDFCVTHWMCEVCWTKVRRRLWNNSATPTEPRNPSCLSYWFARIVCPSYFLTLRNRDASPNGKRFFSPGQNTTYLLKLCIRAVGGTLDIFFHVAQSRHIKISVTNQTQRQVKTYLHEIMLICTDEGFK